VDITSTRTETYPNKGKLPVVEKIGCSLKEDVKRRDFTVNTIAKNCKSGEIIDYAGGINDLKNRKLRVLHKNSFIDDPTRIIRGLKFAVRFGFELEENTKQYQDEYLQNVNYDMSFKRLKDELKDAFNLNKQIVLDKFIEQKMYKLLSDNDFSFYPKNTDTFIKPYLDEIKHIWLIYLGNFDLSNLPLTKIEKKIISDFNEMKSLKDFELYKKFKSSKIESVLLYGLSVNKSSAIDYLDNLRKIKLHINGKDLINMGFEKSKVILDAIEYVEKNKLKNSELTKEDELGLAKKYLDKINSRA